MFVENNGAFWQFLSLFFSADDFRLRSNFMMKTSSAAAASEANNNSPNYYMPIDLKVENNVEDAVDEILKEKSM